MTKSVKKIPIEAAVLDGLEEMVGADLRFGSKVCDGAGDLEDSVIGAGGEGKFLHGLLKQIPLFPSNGAVFANLSVLHAGVAGCGSPLKAGGLKDSGRLYPGPDMGGGLTLFCGAQFIYGKCRNFNMKINAVQQRTADA